MRSLKDVKPVKKLGKCMHETCAAIVTICAAVWKRLKIVNMQVCYLIIQKGFAEHVTSNYTTKIGPERKR